MKTITNIEDYRICLNEVRSTGKQMTVENKMSIEESEKLTDEDVKGLDIVVSENGDEIIPLTKEYMEYSKKLHEKFAKKFPQSVQDRLKKKSA
jgi:hypothetical protein